VLNFFVQLEERPVRVMPLLCAIVIGAVSRSMNTSTVPGEIDSGTKKICQFSLRHGVAPSTEDKCLSIFLFSFVKTADM